MRPYVAKQIVREYVYVFGAVSPCDGRHESLVLPWANTETMFLFLEEVSRRYPDEYILMFMDQAGWHKAKKLRVPANIELAFLPPYSPELNPQEQIWDELREKYCRNKFFKNLEAVVDAVVQGLHHMETLPFNLTRLTQRSWLLNPF